jgi:hypothetical protein
LTCCRANSSTTSRSIGWMSDRAGASQQAPELTADPPRLQQLVGVLRARLRTSTTLSGGMPFSRPTRPAG